MSASRSEKPTRDPEPAEPAPPHYHGHRQRLRQRFLAAGSDAVRDYEVLELIARIGIKPLSAEFGT